MQRLVSAAALAVASLLTPAAPAQSVSKTSAVEVEIVGHGEILLLVADGSTRPCDASNNRVLFNGHAQAGDRIKATSTTGAVCVDHTYGTFRRSQWAGPSIWAAGGRSKFGTGGAHMALEGTVSTDAP